MIGDWLVFFFFIIFSKVCFIVLLINIFRIGFILILKSKSWKKKKIEYFKIKIKFEIDKDKFKNKKIIGNYSLRDYKI